MGPLTAALSACLLHTILGLLTGPGNTRAEQFTLPQFENLPPPVNYFSGESSLELRCAAWPPTAKVIFYNSYRGSPGAAGPPALHPLPTNLRPKQPGVVTIQDLQTVRTLGAMDLHCLASTPYGAVLSGRPFRVVEAKMEDFPPNEGPIPRVLEFMFGNVALVDCYPPESQPRAQVQFLVNNTLIGNSDKYKYITWPGGRRVSLLIQPFEGKDQGYYRCQATNPRTVQRKMAQEVVKLKIKTPRQEEPVRVIMPLSGQTSGPQQIHVREGLNVTLFCVMEGAPPPRITIYKFHPPDTAKTDRMVMDNKFGTLTILNVQPSDEGTYVCSNEVISTTTVLNVTKRLRIEQAPQDIRISALDQPARFTCTTNDPRVIPHWYFNGRLTRATTSDGTLYIEKVRMEHLGVYQCVARNSDEWVTKQATLIRKKDSLVTKQDMKKELPKEDKKGKRKRKKKKKNRDRNKKKKKNKNRIPNDPRLKGKGSEGYIGVNPAVLPAPIATPVFDNLAVRLKWVYKGSQPVDHYRVQFKTLNEYMKGAVETINIELREQVYYITNPDIQAGERYQFRVHAMLLEDTRVNTDPIFSPWSEVVSFQHIARYKPSILKVKPLEEGRVRISWTFTDSRNFPVDAFMILTRREMGRNRDGSISYGGYSNTTIKGGDTNEVVLTGLQAGAKYQFVIYGVSHATGERKITMFSEEIHKKLIPEVLPNGAPKPTTPAPPTGGDNGGLPRWLDFGLGSGESNRLMFIILGALAGLMLLVMLVFLMCCLYRQRREKKRRENNGYAYGYKDPAKVIHRDAMRKNQPPNSSFMLASLSRQQIQMQQQQQQQQQIQANGVMVSPQQRQYGSQMMIGGAMSASQMRLAQQQGHHGSRMALGQWEQGYPGQEGWGSPQWSHQAQMAGYYGGPHGQMKREAPSGGSVHESSDVEDLNCRAETLYQRGGYPSQEAMMYPTGTPYYPSGAYAGTPQKQHYSGSQQHLHGYPAMPAVTYIQPPFQQPVPRTPLQGVRPAHLDVSYGMGSPANDADSVYSYFSQQDVNQDPRLGDHYPPSHDPSGTGFSEAGSQTVTGAAQPHRHHRRRRRKAQMGTGGAVAGAQPPAMPPLGGDENAEEQEALLRQEEYLRQQQEAQDYQQRYHHQQQAQEHQQPPVDHQQRYQNHHQQIPEDRQQNFQNHHQQIPEDHQQNYQNHHQQIPEDHQDGYQDQHQQLPDVHQQGYQNHQEIPEDHQQYYQNHQQQLPEDHQQHHQANDHPHNHRQKQQDQKKRHQQYSNHPQQPQDHHQLSQNSNPSLQHLQQPHLNEVMHAGEHGGDAMYDQPPTSGPMVSSPSASLRLAPGSGVQGHLGQDASTLTRRGTPTLFIEPPRVRDYSEYGIPMPTTSQPPPYSQIAENQ